MTTNTSTIKLVQAVERAISGQGKAIEAIRKLVTTKEGIAALAQRGERYADVAGKPSCDEVKRLRALIRKAGEFVAAENAYRPADEGEEGAALTIKFVKGCASIVFAAKRDHTGDDPVGKALKAYIKACRESEDNIDLARAVEMLNAEWTDEEPSH